MPLLSRRKRVWLVLVGLVAFVWLANNTYRTLLRQSAEQSDTPASRLERGMEMPAGLKLESVAGESSSLGDLRGKVLLINFWAGWCAPCLHEMPGLYELQRRLAGRDFVVLGMNMDDDPKVGLQMLKQRVPGDAPFEMFRGADSSLADSFTIEALPFTVLVDREMKIRLAKAGEVDWRSAEAMRMIEGLL